LKRLRVITHHVRSYSWSGLVISGNIVSDDFIIQDCPEISKSYHAVFCDISQIRNDDDEPFEIQQPTIGEIVSCIKYSKYEGGYGIV